MQLTLAVLQPMIDAVLNNGPRIVALLVTLYAVRWVIDWVRRETFWSWYEGNSNRY